MKKGGGEKWACLFGIERHRERQRKREGERETERGEKTRQL